MAADDLPEIKWNNACLVDSPSPSRASISIFLVPKLGAGSSVRCSLLGTTPHLQHCNTHSDITGNIDQQPPHQAARPTSPLTVNRMPGDGGPGNHTVQKWRSLY